MLSPWLRKLCGREQALQGPPPPLQARTQTGKPRYSIAGFAGSAPHRRPSRHSALNSKYGMSRRVSRASSVAVKLLPLAVLPVPGV